ncbi:head-tail connector protein [Marinobacter sp. BGYM27]|uniref:head-tail connector protein n=1 Tax=Marinobacter sp. BGYM27 TaxID=2975597 RepID=UPI0021A2809C|nr:head-tail connector protein [Marinobacter sp. BGYM27]MDG5498965.1 head-tail connector protein [Marinobacter sp. BGYM27]
MSVMTLEQIKHHLRLELDDESQDAHLENLSEAAEDYAAQYIGQSIPWKDSEGEDVPVPASIKAALLLVIGDLYENREAQIVGTIRADNPAVERLLHFYRVGMGV